jgi:dTDP-4-dehydrorhamnose reductase
VNYYGLTKLDGERYIKESAPQHLVVRTSWLFGPNGRNFVDTILTKTSDGTPLKVVNDQRGCPTYTLDLARGMKRIIGMRVEGIIHMTSSGDATWFDLAKFAVGLAGIEIAIEPVESGQYPTKARRPAYSVLGSVVADSSGLPPLPHWRDGVRHHLLRKGIIKESESN